MTIIYLLKDQVGYYKIGFTKKIINERIQGLQTGNSGNFDIIHIFKTNHNRRLETALHNIFKNKHVLREFYDLNKEDINNFINICNSLEKGFDDIKNYENKYY